MNKALVVILSTVALDAIGGGLIFPILPELLEQLQEGGDIALLYAGMLGVYALMQFVFAPVLGALSDRLGRRPVLMLSLAGAAIDYLVMVFAPYGWLLVVGRAIAGLTSANIAVATAYLTDISRPEERAARFGLLGAVMGAGFIVGPALGGLLGSWWLRSPFLVAAIFNGLNLLVALWILPESHRRNDKPFDLGELNPLRPLLWLARFRSLLPLVAMSMVFGLVGALPGTIWVLYGADRFGWDATMTGLSLGLFGLSMVLSQALLVGPISRRLGGLGTLALGVAFDATAYLAMAFAPNGWFGLAVVPLFALGAIAMPGLQAMLTGVVSDEEQGQLQGLLAGLGSLAGIVGPVATTFIYFGTRDVWSGWVWIIGAGLYVLATPLLFGARKVRFATA